MSEYLDKWEIFRALDDELKENIRLAIVFRENAIFVTEDDEVLAFGKNQNGCLGTGETIPLTEPKRVARLCGKKIKALEYSEDGSSRGSIFAISALGSVFAWGANGKRQLGLGTTGDTMIPARILGGYGKLAPKRVVQVAGTTTYSLALTSDGQVYGFGQRFSTDRDFCVRKLGGPCVTRVMTSIACNDNYPFGVLDSGEVATLLEPRYEKIDMKGLAISKIVCGKSHALALSFDGKVYSGGRSNNEYGQLGNGTTNVGHNLYPMEFISEAIGRVKDIATVNYDEKQPCAAITEKNEVYIWGHYNGQNYLSPSKTTFSTLDEVFAGLGITCRSLKPKERILEVAPLKPKISSPSNTLYDCAGRIIDDAESSDFAFLVEGKKIHVHKLILMMRCTVFKTMFQESNTASEHTIEGHSYVAFYAFLKYFYTDEIDLPPDSALELLALAHFYHLPALQEKCGKFIKRGVTVENAAVIFEKAIQYEAKELEEYVFKFCVDHMTDVISSDAFKTFKPDTVSEFLRRAAQHGAFKN